MGLPAARVTDLHVCPMSDGPKPHVGGPIIPPGCVTVLTGGLPQARVGDVATCVGPPDVIATGSPTVLVGGMMAARMFDTTVHGGKITGGLPTVLIGTGGGAGGGGGGGVVGAAPPVPPTVPPAAPTTPPGGVDLDLAKELSDMAYRATEGQTTADGQWAVAKVHEGKGGFRAIELWDAEGNVRLAFAGSNPRFFSEPVDFFNDWVRTDASQALGGVPDQYKEADRLVARLKAAHGDKLALTGHSLGGGLANYASGLHGVPGVAFNAAPLGAGAQAKIAARNPPPPPRADAFVHYNNHEFVSDSPRVARVVAVGAALTGRRGLAAAATALGGGKNLGTIANMDSVPGGFGGLPGVRYFTGHGLGRVGDTSDIVSVSGPLAAEVSATKTDKPKTTRTWGSQ